MSTPTQSPKKLGAPVIISLVLIVVVAVVFVVLVALPGANTQLPPTPEAVAAESYRAEVDALLAIAQPENAEAALVKYTCTACHRIPDSPVGPEFSGIAERAATRRPPMPADAYVYESIVNPSAYVVEGYQDVMLPDFGTRMSEQELADVLAYLLQPDAQ